MTIYKITLLNTFAIVNNKFSHETKTRVRDRGGISDLEKQGFLTVVFLNRE